MVPFREVARGLRFPEGPVLMPDGSIVLVEIEGRSLTRVSAAGVKEVIAQLGGGPNGAALGPDGQCYVCNNGGFEWHHDAQHGLRPVGQASDYSGGRIERVDLESRSVEVLYTQCDGIPLRGPNDLVFDTVGGFYFTDLGKTRGREMDLGCVYYAQADGSGIRQLAFPLFTPNGIGLSPDGKLLYVAETETCRLWAFDLREPGVIEPAAWPPAHGGRIVAGLGGYQKFDSLAVDDTGHIYVATLLNGGITRISPDGQHVTHTPLPDKFVTNLCFSKDFTKAYVTLSGTGRLIEVERAHLLGAVSFTN